MERTVIEHTNIQAIVIFIISLIIVIVCIALWFYSIFDAWFIIVGSVIGGLLIYSRRKEVIIMDDSGLTLVGAIGKFGPIPWDCISDATLGRELKIGRRILTVKLTNVYKLIEIFGEDVITESFGTNKSKLRLEIDLDNCKLRGIDVVARINEYKAGYSN